MNSNTPANDKLEYDRRKQAVMLCGRNMGPHAYIPMSWIRTDTSEHVAHLLCTVCFTRVNVETLYKHFPEAKI